jgi:membrane protease YdiL (CAAX protease family)
MMLRHLWSFVRRPVYSPYSKLPPVLRFRIVFGCVVWNLIIAIGLVILTEGLFLWLGIDAGKHKTEEMFLNFSLLQIFLLLVIVAPFTEELIFRGPLVFFKNSAYFPVAFYLSCLIFGLVHLGNFEEGSSLLLWAPLLVAPQLIMGFFLGYLRVKLGLGYAILMHLTHNGILYLVISFSGII